MGFKLRREVRDTLPRNVLTPSERIVLLELADNANDDTRKAFPGREELAELTHFSERSVKELLQDVWAKWIDIRVVFRFDKNGVPVYAYRGRAAEYLFPRDLEAAYRQAEAERKGDGNPVPFGSPKGDVDGAPFEGERGRKSRREGDGDQAPFGAERGRDFRPPLPQERSTSYLSSRPGEGERAASGNVVAFRSREREIPSSKIKPGGLSQTVLDTLAQAGVGPDEAETLAPAMIAEYGITSDGWWITAARNGTLTDRVHEHRRNAERISERRGAQRFGVVLAADRRCSRHPDQPALNCGPCRHETQAVTAPAAGPSMTAAEAREQMRAITAAAAERNKRAADTRRPILRGPTTPVDDLAGTP